MKTDGVTFVPKSPENLNRYICMTDWFSGGSTNSYKLKFLLRKFVPAFAEHFRVMCVLEVRGIETFPRNFLLNATIRSQLPEGFPKNPGYKNFLVSFGTCVEHSVETSSWQCP